MDGGLGLCPQVNELIERIKSLEELLVQKGIAIDKANRQNKALGKLVSGIGDSA